LDVTGPPESVASDLNERLTLAEAIAHPVKGRVLTALTECPDATIRQVAERLGEPIRRVRHQVQVLVAEGLVEVVGEDQRRGVVERRYGRRGPVAVEDDTGMSMDLRVGMATAVIKLLLADIAAAARAGTFGKLPDRCDARFYGRVDKECFEELAAIYLHTYRAVDEAINAGRARVRGSGRPGMEVTAALFFFETPLWGPVADSEAPDADRSTTENG
jgi:DNA-binding transcriptional ArsR family regulator